jgi:hypothetical protein
MPQCTPIQHHNKKGSIVFTYTTNITNGEKIFCPIAVEYIFFSFAKRKCDRLNQPTKQVLNIFKKLEIISRIILW